MIFDTLENLKKYSALIPSIQTVLAVLDGEDLLHKAKGAYVTEDKNCRYNIAEYITSARDKHFEIHKKELDLQIMLSGCEVMTTASPNLCSKAGPYDESGDCSLVDGKTLSIMTVNVDSFVIFFPGEPHKPGLSDGMEKSVKKVIFKIVC